MLRNYFLLTILTIIFLSGCRKSEDVFWDANYPTTINKLDDQILNKLKVDFYKNNIYITSSLNQFGFCDLEEIHENSFSPPLLNVLSETEAINKAKDFIEKNKKFLGAPNSLAIDFSRAELSTGIYWDNASWWFLVTKNQKIDTIDVLNTDIRVNIKNQEVVFCVGNWYPSVYIPHDFQVNQSKARSILLGRSVSHITFGGDVYKVKISQGDLDASKINLKIYPVETEDKIQLHVIWAINIPAPVYYLIYVDVMTGEIIGEQPTIIS